MVRRKYVRIKSYPLSEQVSSRCSRITQSLIRWLPFPVLETDKRGDPHTTYLFIQGLTNEQKQEHWDWESLDLGRVGMADPKHIPDPNDFRNLTATFSSRDTSLVKFSSRTDQFIEPNRRKCQQCQPFSHVQCDVATRRRCILCRCTRAWNQLPTELKLVHSSTTTITQHLKTFEFNSAYTFHCK